MYRVVHGKGSRPYKIVLEESGHRKIVGSSTTRKDAEASIVHRVEAETKIEFTNLKGRV